MDSSNGDIMIGDYKEQDLLRRASEVVAEKVKGSTVFDVAAENRFPRYSLSELKVGRVLGRGGFCVVSEIKKITLSDEIGESSSRQLSEQHDDNDDDDDYISNIVQDRNFMQANCIRKGNHARYAIKILSDTSLKDPHIFINGLVDLAIEARFLSVIRHANIIKMRALSVGDPFQRSFFLVLDRLYDTLSQRMHKWKKRKVTGVKKLFDVKNRKKTAFWVERITVAFDLASALKYLHSINVVYRDLKPDNIGFDVRGDVKIFDFGLAKELSPDAKVGDLYELTGDTGSLRYMAPEVAIGKPYNETVDVFSFSVLLYQILALEVPYEGYTVSMFERKVVRGGHRPKVNEKWPLAISQAMKDSWGEEIFQRPSMEEWSGILREEINSLVDDDVSELLDVSRKSEVAHNSSELYGIQS